MCHMKNLCVNGMDVEPNKNDEGITLLSLECRFYTCSNTPHTNHHMNNISGFFPHQTVHCNEPLLHALVAQ